MEIWRIVFFDGLCFWQWCRKETKGRTRCRLWRVLCLRNDYHLSMRTGKQVSERISATKRKETMKTMTANRRRKKGKQEEEDDDEENDEEEDEEESLRLCRLVGVCVCVCVKQGRRGRSLSNKRGCQGHLVSQVGQVLNHNWNPTSSRNRNRKIKDAIRVKCWIWEVDSNTNIDICRMKRIKPINCELVEI